jgi:hypothetical protein
MIGQKNIIILLLDKYTIKISGKAVNIKSMAVKNNCDIVIFDYDTVNNKLTMENTDVHGRISVGVSFLHGVVLGATESPVPQCAKTGANEFWLQPSWRR